MPKPTINFVCLACSSLRYFGAQASGTSVSLTTLPTRVMCHDDVDVNESKLAEAFEGEVIWESGEVDVDDCNCAGFVMTAITYVVKGWKSSLDCSVAVAFAVLRGSVWKVVLSLWLEAMLR